MDVEYIELSQKKKKRPVMCKLFYIFLVLELLLLLPFIAVQLRPEPRTRKWISMSVCLSSTVMMMMIIMNMMNMIIMMMMMISTRPHTSPPTATRRPSSSPPGSGGRCLRSVSS